MADDSAKVEFFESRIRPVLVEQCYSCHNSSGTAEGDLAVDHRDALQNGGASGALIDVQSPDESLLLQVIRHEVDGQEMPEDAPKLDDRVIADFRQWIADGAVDPRDEPPSANELASWAATRDERAQQWSFQPITDPAPPTVKHKDWSEHSIDQFILAKLEDADLQPVGDADRRPLIRRLTFALTGLPPTPEQIERFLADQSEGAYERLVDDLLASEHFGERWARHWMDWVRYAETHGSEGDPTVPFAWRYRDYLIRALNADVPYDQLVREHLAGDLIPDPRINDELGINESMLGSAQFRFVQHGFAPTDALDELVRFTDDQIDVISKAFLGLTVSCARCHNHKFDPISQQDYYALFGVMVSTRPATVSIDTPARQDIHRDEMTAIKERVKSQLADSWLQSVDSLTEQLDSSDGPWSQAIEKADDVKHPLHVWKQLRSLSGEEFASNWIRLREEYRQSRSRLDDRDRQSYPWHADLSHPEEYERWYAHGAGLRHGEPSLAGNFAIAPEGETIITDILPGGVYSHSLSTKHNGVLSSPRIRLEHKHLYVRVSGGGEARARYVVQHYPRRGTVYPLKSLNDGNEQWVHWDMTYWQGDDVYLEISTAADQPVELDMGAERSWFGVTEAVLLTDEQQQGGFEPRDEMAEFVAPLFTDEQAPTDAATLQVVYADALRACILAWRDGEMTNEQARFLNSFVREGLLPNTREAVPDVAALVDVYRALEAEVPVPTRAPGVIEANVIDQPLMVRGNHKKQADPIPRHFLEVIDATPFASTSSGRLELAEDIVRADNPLAARVIVNRIWHHLFGRGLVETPDNFGRVGAKPSHPELLDWLATRFVEEGWSIKSLIRQIVTTRTYQLASTPSPQAAEKDPDNRLLSHAPLHRLEAEAIRDAMLMAAGELSDEQFGPPQSVESSRRSIYLTVQRNSMIPQLTVFDQPKPFSTKGRRDVTNVPGQSLTLMNDPVINSLARRWAERQLMSSGQTSEGTVSPKVQIQQMFLAALGRPPTENEVRDIVEYIESATTEYSAARDRLAHLNRSLVELRERRESLLTPVRERLLAEQGQDASSTIVDLNPIAQWDFDEDLQDSVGSLDAQAEGNAVLQDGALVVDGKSHAVTAPLDHDLGEKTLEVWVQLDDLDQRGGGVLTVQTKNGVVFDSIVIGEKQARRWLAGSNGFVRTQAFGGTDESEAAEQPVHVAITYTADGIITGYRNGQPYGQPYQSSGLNRYLAGDTVVTFGLRHLPATGNRFLNGRILQARLYDRALSVEEVAAASREDSRFVPLKDLLAELSPEQREEYDQLVAEIEQSEAEQQQLAAIGNETGPVRAWQEVAMTIFNLKEFIYVR
ncbi:MAG: DUF1553 domain-containing protein [Planctomycetaceae bacterium]